MKKLAIISTHPIQYNAPLFKLLTDRKNISVKVFYTWENSQFGKFDAEFGKFIDWDIPLFEGYEYSFVKNTSGKQASKSFFGIKNPTLISEIENWKADCVLIFGWNFYSHLQAIRYFKGKTPVLFRGDSTILDDKNDLKTFARRFFLRWVYKKIDYALFVGTNNRKYYEAVGVSADKLVFAPHAIENERFFDTDGKFKLLAEKFKIDLDLKPETFTLLFAGKFIKKKNPFYLLNFLEYIKNIDNKLFNKINILYVGNGILEKELRNEAIKYNNVFFMPFQNQSVMPAVYRIADLFVLPSVFNETWGLALNESLACGIPVAATLKVGGAIDLIKNFENGVLLKDSCDYDNLHKYILQITNDEKNLVTFNKEFSFEEICRNIEKIVLSE